MPTYTVQRRCLRKWISTAATLAIQCTTYHMVHKICFCNQRSSIFPGHYCILCEFVSTTDFEAASNSRSWSQAKWMKANCTVCGIVSKKTVNIWKPLFLAHLMAECNHLYSKLGNWISHALWQVSEPRRPKQISQGLLIASPSRQASLSIVLQFILTASQISKTARKDCGMGT